MADTSFLYGSDSPWNGFTSGQDAGKAIADIAALRNQRKARRARRMAEVESTPTWNGSWGPPEVADGAAGSFAAPDNYVTQRGDGPTQLDNFIDAGMGPDDYVSAPDASAPSSIDVITGKYASDQSSSPTSATSNVSAPALPEGYRPMRPQDTTVYSAYQDALKKWQGTSWLSPGFLKDERKRAVLTLASQMQGEIEENRRSAEAQMLAILQGRKLAVSEKDADTRSREVGVKEGALPSENEERLARAGKLRAETTRLGEPEMVGTPQMTSEGLAQLRRLPGGSADWVVDKRLRQAPAQTATPFSAMPNGQIMDGRTGAVSGEKELPTAAYGPLERIYADITLTPEEQDRAAERIVGAARAARSGGPLPTAPASAKPAEAPKTPGPIDKIIEAFTGGKPAPSAPSAAPPTPPAPPKPTPGQALMGAPAAVAGAVAKKASEAKAGLSGRIADFLGKAGGAARYAADMVVGGKDLAEVGAQDRAAADAPPMPPKGKEPRPGDPFSWHGQVWTWTGKGWKPGGPRG